MADSTRELPGYFQPFEMHGRRMAHEAVTRLVGSKENQLVLFGGTSAGGRGSMVTIDALR